MNANFVFKEMVEVALTPVTYAWSISSSTAETSTPATTAQISRRSRCAATGEARRPCAIPRQ
ncbi:MAG: hypothetical protein ACRESS_11325 [Stenotrophobium sp.]